MSLAATLQDVRLRVTQEQTAKERLIFAILHPSDGDHRIGSGHVGHPIGEHLATLHKLVMAPELRDEGFLNSDTPAGRKLFKDAMRVGTMGDWLVMPAGQDKLHGDHGRYDPSTHILHLEDSSHAASPDDHTRTLVHELAHAFIVKANGEQWLQPEPASHANSGRDLDEVVAEGATYLVAKHYGLDTGEKSLGKIHMDSGPGHDLFHDPETLQKIRDTASAMLKELDPIAKPTLPKVTAQPYLETNLVPDPVVREMRQEVKQYAVQALGRIGKQHPTYPVGPDLLDMKDVRVELRQKNAEILSARTGGKLSVADAYKFQDQWSAATDTPHSMLLQRAIGERFDIAPPKSWSDRLRRDYIGDSTPHSVGWPDFFQGEQGAEWAKKASLFVEAQYAETQDYYKRLGVTHVTLHRGIVFETNSSVPGPLKKGVNEWFKQQETKLEAWRSKHGWGVPFQADTSRLGTAKNVKMHPLSSFSLDHGVAINFTSRVAPISYVVSASVPVERIFGNGVTGVGAAIEGEHVIIGGPTDLAFEEWWRR